MVNLAPDQAWPRMSTYAGNGPKTVMDDIPMQAIPIRTDLRTYT